MLRYTLALVGVAASAALPPQTPIPGAPTSACSFPHLDSSTPLRITVGNGPIPYQFACGFNRPAGVCAVDTLAPGYIVSLGPVRNDWACVTGEGPTAGWIPAANLAPAPTAPSVPVSEWLGWWRHRQEVKGVKNDRLLITRKPGSDVLHISGRAYWYGAKDDVHFGSIQADAAPIGRYLHAIEPPSAACVVDLKIDPAAHTLQANDNMGCGGMNVRFSGVWIHFTPAPHE